MNYFNKRMVFLVLMLFGYGIDALAYTYTIVNQTGRDVKVQLHYDEVVRIEPHIRPGNTDDLIKQGDTLRSIFRAGLCLNKIMVSTKNSVGSWGEPREAKKKFLREDGTEITEESIANLYSTHDAWLIVGMCQSKEFFLRIDQKSQVISAIIMLSLTKG